MATIQYDPRIQDQSAQYLFQGITQGLGGTLQAALQEAQRKQQENDMLQAQDRGNQIVLHHLMTTYKPDGTPYLTDQQYSDYIKAPLKQRSEMVKAYSTNMATDFALARQANVGAAIVQRPDGGISIFRPNAPQGMQPPAQSWQQNAMPTVLSGQNQINPQIAGAPAGMQQQPVQIAPPPDATLPQQPTSGQQPAQQGRTFAFIAPDGKVVSMPNELLKQDSKMAGYVMTYGPNGMRLLDPRTGGSLSENETAIGFIDEAGKPVFPPGQLLKPPLEKKQGENWLDNTGQAIGTWSASGQPIPYPKDSEASKPSPVDPLLDPTSKKAVPGKGIVRKTGAVVDTTTDPPQLTLDPTKNFYLDSKTEGWKPLNPAVGRALRSAQTLQQTPIVPPQQTWRQTIGSWISGSPPMITPSTTGGVTIQGGSPSTTPTQGAAPVPQRVAVYDPQGKKFTLPPDQVDSYLQSHSGWTK